MDSYLASKRQSKYCAPTWSWASVTGGVAHFRIRFNKYCVRIPGISSSSRL